MLHVYILFYLEKKFIVCDNKKNELYVLRIFKRYRFFNLFILVITCGDQTST